MPITTKQFQKDTDLNLVWNFLVEVYDREKGGGVAAPFFEYALCASWMDDTYLSLDRLWFDGPKVVGFVFYESPVTDIYFRIRPGYEFLAEEMVDYAMDHMPDFESKQQFVLFNGQEYLMEIAEKRGFTLQFDYENRVFDFANELNHGLPAGFHFVDAADADPVKLAKCCWYGFNHHLDKGEFVNWTAEDESPAWTPAKAYQGILDSFQNPPPHSTYGYNIIIADQNDEYVCFSGMWWVRENHLAYMEPLCTVPQYRKMGLASAALTEHYRRLKPLGATHMTGGGDPFYEKIGYGKGSHWYFYARHH
ncbi:MAG: GNAT family N-acetyltransferase [Clostridia bacterium]|nr:GNAT family N-acetyltransferase [Clostridia bacterium]